MNTNRRKFLKSVFMFFLGLPLLSFLRNCDVSGTASSKSQDEFDLLMDNLPKVELPRLENINGKNAFKIPRSAIFFGKNNIGIERSEGVVYWFFKDKDNYNCLQTLIVDIIKLEENHAYINIKETNNQRQFKLKQHVTLLDNPQESIKKLQVVDSSKLKSTFVMMR